MPLYDYEKQKTEELGAEIAALKLDVDVERQKIDYRDKLIAAAEARIEELTAENAALKAEVLKLKGGGLDLLNEILRFETAAKNLLDSLSFDDNGAMVGGKWMGGEGGLLSEKTRKLADALRRLLGGAE